MKRLLALVLFLWLPSCVPVWSVEAWEPAKTKEEVKRDESIKEVLWQGGTDEDMLKQVREDISNARDDKKIKTLKVTLLSPGGLVVTALEIARLVRKASDAGLVVEIHAVALCASGCTFVLAAGTPGKRFISSEAFFLVHAPQQRGYASSECVKYVPDPKTVDDKITNVILDMLRDAYIKYTGHKAAEVETWLTCEKEIVGPGTLAVAMGIADKTD